MIISSVDVPNRMVVVSSFTNIPFELFDDDSFKLPEWPNLDLSMTSYRKAYIEVVLDGGGDPNNNSQDVPFILNIGKPNEAIEDALNETNGLQSHKSRRPYFWIAYVLNGYQWLQTEDIDPDAEIKISPTEGAAVAVTASSEIGSVMFTEQETEVIKQLSIANPDRERSSTVAHEIGHQFGLTSEDHKLGGIMGPSGNGATSFHPKHLAWFRARINSPGQ